MEDEEMNQKNENNIYLYKTIYLIRINLPSSEFIYIIMFILKYIGLIILSISLNEWENNNNENDLIKREKLEPEKKLFSLQSFLSNIMITGNNLKILNNHYPEICIIGFCLLLIYILSIFFGLIYMRNKYYNKNIISSTEKK